MVGLQLVRITMIERGVAFRLRQLLGQVLESVLQIPLFFLVHILGRLEVRYLLHVLPVLAPELTHFLLHQFDSVVLRRKCLVFVG